MPTEAIIGAETRLPITQITPNPNNPRVMLDKAELAGLGASLAAVGLIQPILVRPKGLAFEIVAGHRRFEAAKSLGWAEISVIVREVKDTDLMGVATTENVQRADMHPLDEGLACRRLTLEEGRTQVEVAALLAKSQAWVAQRLSLLGLSPKCRKAFKEGKFSIAVALVLARVPNVKLQDQIFEESKDHDGFLTTSASSLADEILQNTAQALAQAPFDPKDAQLHPKAGACLTCPKRSSACASLFEDLQKKSDLCLDSECWDTKAKAHQAAVLKDAKAKNLTILEGEAAQKASYSGAYVKLDESCYEHPQRWAWRRVLAGRPFEVVLVLRQDSLTECVSKETATAALTALLPPQKQKKLQKELSDAKARKMTEQKTRKSIVEKGLTDREYTYEAARQAGAVAVKGGLTPAIQGLVLDHLLGSLNHDGKRHTCLLFGQEPMMGQYGKDFDATLLKWRKALEKKDELGTIVALIVMRESAFSTEPLKKLLPAIGLDPAQVHKKAVATRVNQKAMRSMSKKKK